MDHETRKLPGVTMLVYPSLLRFRIKSSIGWVKFLCFTLKRQLVPVAGKI